MTENEISRIEYLRSEGYGAARISEDTGISINTIKSYLRRHKPLRDGHICLFCGKPVVQTPGRKEKKFCSDECRSRWWNSHHELMQMPSAREYTCACCGRHFKSYQNRKYCSHSCYITDRFGGGESDD